MRTPHLAGFHPTMVVMGMPWTNLPGFDIHMNHVCVSRKLLRLYKGLSAVWCLVSVMWKGLTLVVLRDQLAEALPHVLAPTPRKADVVPDIHPRKEGGSPPNLLATDDAVIQAEALLEVARYLRDNHGYSMLTNITATDYLKDQLIEVVYHFLNLNGGAPAVLKVRTARDEPVIPSLTPEWPGASFQEREAYDLYGVVFEGHPDLRRLFMWDEFEGFPMRKDFPKQGDKYFSDDSTD